MHRHLKRRWGLRKQRVFEGLRGVPREGLAFDPIPVRLRMVETAKEIILDWVANNSVEWDNIPQNNAFEEDRVDFTGLQCLVEKAEALSSEELDPVSWVVLSEGVRSLIPALTLARSFDPRKGENVNEAREKLKAIFVRAAPLVLSVEGARYAESRQDLLNRKEKLRELEVDASKMLEHAMEALEAAKDAALKQGIANEVEAFSAAADMHRKSAMYWVVGAIVLALVLVTAGACHLGASPPLPEKSWTTASNLSFFAGRLLIASVLSFFLVVCVRNYRSVKHNELSNAHRANALKTFRAFKAAARSGVGDAVLLQATDAIFKQIETGYSTGGVGETTHIAELLKIARKSEG